MKYNTSLRKPKPPKFQVGLKPKTKTVVDFKDWHDCAHSAFSKVKKS